MPKITEYTPPEFTGDKIDNCFYVYRNEYGEVTSSVSILTIFEEIKRRSLEDKGLTIEFTGDNIIFIKGRKMNG
jgi:hypothetical protein